MNTVTFRAPGMFNFLYSVCPRFLAGALLDTNQILLLTIHFQMADDFTV